MEKVKDVEHDFSCDCGSTIELICTSLPYVELPKFRCLDCNNKLYKQIILNK